MTMIDGLKTYLVLAGAIIAAVLGFMNGDLTAPETWAAVLASLTAGGFRSAIKKVEK